MFQEFYNARSAALQAQLSKEMNAEQKHYNRQRADIIKNYTVNGKLTEKGNQLLAQLEQSQDQSHYHYSLHPEQVKHRNYCCQPASFPNSEPHIDAAWSPTFFGQGSVVLPWMVFFHMS